MSVGLSYWYASIKYVLKLSHVLSFAAFFLQSRIGAVNQAVLLMIFMVIHRIRSSRIVSLPALEKVMLSSICLKRMAMGIFGVHYFAVLVLFSLSILDSIWPY